MIYLVGSLRNKKIPEIANILRSATNMEVFDDWFAAGPEADDYWRDYERNRGRKITEALEGHAARNVFGFDKFHIDRSDAVVLCLPCGKSGHLELGYAIGRGKNTIVLLDGDPDRYDVMYQFADKVVSNPGELIKYLVDKDRGYAERPSPGSSLTTMQAMEEWRKFDGQ